MDTIDPRIKGEFTHGTQHATPRSMPAKEYVLDGTKFKTLSEAASEFTRALEFSHPWTGNLDVFDELLDQSEPATKDKKVIVWRNSEHSRKQLNYEETVRWYEKHLLTCDTFCFPTLEQKLAEAQEGQGPTVFDWLVEIIQQHRHVDLRLE
jgi:hypothetical protein